MASVLIMALDGTGEIRFVGEVPRGAACSCFCPICGSPLVAKQGQENEWHFSHEASQERPECDAGAENLARSLGIEYLQKQEAAGVLVFPEYKTAASVNSIWLSSSLPVQWSAQLAEPLVWRDHPAKNHAVATASLDTGARFAIFVQVGDAGVPQLGGLQLDCAYASLVVAPTWPPGTRTRADVMEAIRVSASFRWWYHPDTLGLRAAAQNELETQEAAIRHRIDHMQVERAAAAGRRWAGVSLRLAQNGIKGRQDGAAPPALSGGPHDGTSEPVKRAKEGTRYPQFPGHALGCNFQFFRLGVDEAWVFYPLGPEFIETHLQMSNPNQERPKKLWAIAPAGGPIAGWDECLPRNVGVADVELGIYWVRDHLPAMMFLSPRSKETQMSGNPSAFQISL